jgi:prepilin-type N-terminal cleavage/methylation domain-containing protein
MKKLHYISNHDQRAFSLVEVLVSITILLLVVVTPMTIISRANNSTSFANEQMIAFFLAQEGLELVEKVRNDLYLQYFRTNPLITNPMTQFRSTALNHCYGTSGCGLSLSGGVVSQFACSGTNCRVYRSTNRYVQSTSQPPGSTLTPFTRVVRMNATNSSSGRLRDVRVTATVTWRTGSLIAGQRVELVTYLSNVYDTP